MLRTAQLCLAAIAATLLVNSATVRAEDYPELKFRFATGFPQALYMTEPNEYFARELKARSNGKIVVRTFYGGALGKSNEIFDLVSKGAIDMGSVVQGYVTSSLPFAAMANSLPMTFFDGEAAMRAAMALEETNPDQKAEFEKANIKPLIHRYLPNYKLICTKPVRTVEDLKGLKIRTFGSYMPIMFSALEVTPVNVLPTDMYEALKRGSMDCSYLTNANFIAYKLHEVAKYIIDVKFGGINAYYLAINLDRWNGLPENVQKLMLEVGKEATEFGVQDTIRAEKEALETMVAQGAEVIKFEEQEKLQAAVPDMIEIWISEMAKLGKETEARRYASEIKALLKMN